MLDLLEIIDLNYHCWRLMLNVICFKCAMWNLLADMSVLFHFRVFSLSLFLSLAYAKHCSMERYSAEFEISWFVVAWYLSIYPSKICLQTICRHVWYPFAHLGHYKCHTRKPSVWITTWPSRFEVTKEGDWCSLILPGCGTGDQQWMAHRPSRCWLWDLWPPMDGSQTF